MIHETIQLLGLPAKDKVTGFAGVITSVHFDLYGCVVAVVCPSAKDDKLADSRAFDIHRLEITSQARVMPVPDYDKVVEQVEPKAAVLPADYGKGAAELPVPETTRDG